MRQQGLLLSSGKLLFIGAALLLGAILAAPTGAEDPNDCVAASGSVSGCYGPPLPYPEPPWSTVKPEPSGCCGHSSGDTVHFVELLVKNNDDNPDNNVVYQQQQDIWDAQENAHYERVEQINEHIEEGTLSELPPAPSSRAKGSLEQFVDSVVDLIFGGDDDE